VSAVPREAWIAAGQAARGHAPDLAEALAAHIASGPDGRRIAQMVGAAIARAAHDAVEAAEPHIRAAIYAELGNDHYVIFTEDGWTTEHSVECRLSGHMHECTVHSAIGEWAQDDPPVPGRWRVVSADGPVPVLDRADLIPGGETGG